MRPAATYSAAKYKLMLAGVDITRRRCAERRASRVKHQACSPHASVLTHGDDAEVARRS